MVLGSSLENAVIMYDVGLLHQPARRPGRRPNSAESNTRALYSTSLWQHLPSMSDHVLIHRFTQSGTSTWTPLPASPLLGRERTFISNHRASLPAQSKAQVDLGVNSTAFSLKLYWRHGRDCLRGHRVHIRSAGRK